uniref:Uncharacterized protein n=1 Tax=Varanus komodoensis TaxID=61221 RepID=A0A8D2IQT6_VARKO
MKIGWAIEDQSFPPASTIKPVPITKVGANLFSTVPPASVGLLCAWPGLAERANPRGHPQTPTGPWLGPDEADGQSARDPPRPALSGRRPRGSGRACTHHCPLGPGWPP